MITTNTDKCIDSCNRLLRGERSAVETYEQSMKKFSNDPSSATLTRIRDEHVESVHALEESVKAMGGVPDKNAGAWGVFARTVHGAASLFGTDSALEALQAGERSGESDYDNALEDDDVMPGCKDLIRGTLLPKVTKHIHELARLQSES